MKSDEPRTFHDFEKLLAKYKVKTEWVKIIVAFGDIVSFAPWLRRAINTPDERKFIITRLYSKLAYMRNVKGLFTKGMGDGAMIVRELGKGHNCNIAIDFLRELSLFNTYMNEVINHLDFPRPDGFRVRVCLGNALKLYLNNCKYPCSMKLDYVEYPTILAARMLVVAKRKYPLIAHESVKDLIGAKADKAGIEFHALESDTLKEFRDRMTAHGIDGIDNEDLNSLFAFKILETKEA